MRRSVLGFIRMLYVGKLTRSIRSLVLLPLSLPHAHIAYTLHAHVHSHPRTLPYRPYRPTSPCIFFLFLSLILHRGTLALSPLFVALFAAADSAETRAPLKLVFLQISPLAADSHQSSVFLLLLLLLRLYRFNPRQQSAYSFPSRFRESVFRL